MDGSNERKTFAFSLVSLLFFVSWLVSVGLVLSIEGDFYVHTVLFYGLFIVPGFVFFVSVFQGKLTLNQAQAFLNGLVIGSVGYAMVFFSLILVIYLGSGGVSLEVLSIFEDVGSFGDRMLMVILFGVISTASGAVGSLLGRLLKLGVSELADTHEKLKMVDNSSKEEKE